MILFFLIKIEALKNYHYINKLKRKKKSSDNSRKKPYVEKNDFNLKNN